MELIFVFLILFASKVHKKGFSHFSGEDQKEVFFYNPWIEADILIEGYSTGIRGSGFLNLPKNRQQLTIQVVEAGEVLFEQCYQLHDQFMMIFIPQIKKSHLRRVLP